ncbi:MAG: twin-arginine translocase subunit TatC [Syntrophobacteraceae bacterium]|nr:twin-arginine translocase subunit TatC [Syntrophobacteraceae bacterium]
MSDEENKMPLFQHLEELRSRILICGLAIGVGFVLCYFFKERVFDLFIMPWVKALPAGQPYKLIYTVPYEAFLAEMEVSFIMGTILAAPVLLWQIWRFVAPGLYANERKYILPVIFCSSLFFAGGVLFGYFIVVPVAFKFFATPASPYITPMMSIDKYLSFAEKMLLSFGLVFELPVFAFFLAKLGVLSSDFLRRKRKWAIVLIFILAAVLTPSPDVVSQLLMALPLLVLYEVSVWVVYFFGGKPTEVANQTGE